MYKVISDFYDLQDDRRKGRRPSNYQHYTPGDVYPREGFIPSPRRLAELAGSNNALGRPLIKEETPENFTEEKSKRKRRAKANGDIEH